MQHKSQSDQRRIHMVAPIHSPSRIRSRCLSRSFLAGGLLCATASRAGLTKIWDMRRWRKLSLRALLSRPVGNLALRTLSASAKKSMTQSAVLTLRWRPSANWTLCCWRNVLGPSDGGGTGMTTSRGTTAIVHRLLRWKSCARFSPGKRGFRLRS